MKIRGAFSDELTGAHVAGAAYFWQAITSEHEFLLRKPMKTMKNHERTMKQQ